MNRNIVAVIIVLILIIIAGIFIRLKNPEETPKKIITQTKKVNTASPKTPENSINNLLKMRKGPPKTCVYSIGENAKYASGVIYFANGKTRVDFSLENESEFISGHGIILAGPSYFWMDSARQGIEMEVNLNESSATQSANSLPLASLVTNLKQDISYTCSDWTGNENRFEIPTGILFTEITLQDVVSEILSGQKGNKTTCLICNSLPEGKTQISCKAQFSCKT